jgi:hypothetical protein
MGDRVTKPASQTARRRALKQAASSIVELTAPVFEHLERIAEAARTMQLADATVTGLLPEGDVNLLERVAVAAIRGPELITGAGMAAVSEQHPESGMMNWWILRGDDVVSKRHILNPHSDSYYDFSHSRWFQVPAESGRSTLIAPYVDSWGTDDLTITAAIPLPDDGSGITTIVAADLDARSYVQQVEQLLRSASPAALLDGEDRAVASTVPEMETGVRLTTVPTWKVQERISLVDLEWSLVLLRA